MNSMAVNSSLGLRFDVLFKVAMESAYATLHHKHKNDNKT